MHKLFQVLLAPKGSGAFKRYVRLPKSEAARMTLVAKLQNPYVGEMVKAFIEYAIQYGEDSGLKSTDQLIIETGVSLFGNQLALVRNHRSAVQEIWSLRKKAEAGQELFRIVSDLEKAAGFSHPAFENWLEKWKPR